MKQGSTTKNAHQIKHGRSYLTVTSSASDGGGDKDQKVVAKRSTKGMRPGTGLPNGPGPESYRGRNRHSFKTVEPRGQNDSGGRIDEWCQGKRGSYK